MSKNAIIPEILVMPDLDSGTHDIYARSYGQTTPAGPRLLRGYPHPEITYSHDTQEDAERDAEALRQYLAECAKGKRKDVEPLGRGWWET